MFTSPMRRAAHTSRSAPHVSICADSHACVAQRTPVPRAGTATVHSVHMGGTFTLCRGTAKLPWQNCSKLGWRARPTAAVARFANRTSCRCSSNARSCRSSASTRVGGRPRSTVRFPFTSDRVHNYQRCVTQCDGESSALLRIKSTGSPAPR